MTWAEDVQHALDQLGASDVALRKSGASALVELATEPEAEGQLHPHFVRLLSDPLPDLRAAACAGLRLSGPREDLVPLLEPRLADSDAPVRREAAWTLGSLEQPAFAPLLRRALQDADAQVAFEAAVGLAALHDAAGADVLLAAVDDSVRRFAALGGLTQLAEPRARPLAERLLGKFFINTFDRTQAAGLLARLGVEAGRAHLISRLSRSRADDRGLAMELCGAHRVLAAIPLLRQALHDRQDPLRGTAARSLGLLGEDPSGDTLNVMASDPTEDFDTRCEAMEGLMFLGTPGSLAALQRLGAEGEDAKVREAAQDALTWLATSAERGKP